MSSGSEAGKLKTVPQYWTNVRDRSQLKNQQVRTFDIELDVAGLVNEKAYKLQQQEVNKVYLFDTDSFKKNDETLVPANHALTVD